MTARKTAQGRPTRRTKPPKVTAARKRRLKRFAPTELPPVAGGILALDVSSETVGWALFEDSELVNYGKWHPKGESGEHGEKLTGFSDWLGSLLENTAPKYLLVERPYPGRNRKAYGVLMRYFGAAEIAHYRHFRRELPEHQSLPPKQVKEQLEASVENQTYEQRKALMVEIINKLYGLQLTYKPRSKRTDDDIADAIAVGHAWLSRRKRKEKTDE